MNGLLAASMAKVGTVFPLSNSYLGKDNNKTTTAKATPTKTKTTAKK